MFGDEHDVQNEEESHVEQFCGQVVHVGGDPLLKVPSGHELIQIPLKLKVLGEQVKQLFVPLPLQVPQTTLQGEHLFVVLSANVPAGHNEGAAQVLLTKKVP